MTRPAAGDDPLAAWRAAGADMMAALEPAALARLVPGPWGQMPLGEILERYAMEFLVHTWDVARATGQVAVLDPGLVRDALEPGTAVRPACPFVGTCRARVRRGRGRRDLTRLLAIFGRNTWTSASLIRWPAGLLLKVTKSAH